MDNGMSRIRPRQVAAVATLVADAAGQETPELLDLMVSRLRDILDADGVTIELEQDGRLVCCCASGHARRWVGRSEPVAGSLAGLCFDASEPLISADVQSDRRMAECSASEPEVYSMVSVPVVLNGRVVGILRALGGAAGAFSGNQLVMARLAVAAIQRVLMHDLRKERGPSSDQLLTLGLWALRDRRKSQVLRAGEPGYRVSMVRLDITGYLTSEILGHVSMLVRSTDQCLREDAGAYSVIMPGTAPEDAAVAADRIKRELEAFASSAGEHIEVSYRVDDCLTPAIERRTA